MDMTEDLVPDSKSEESKPAERVPLPPSDAMPAEEPAATPKRSPEASTENVEPTGNDAHDPVNDKSDSEAETVVLSGNKEGQDHNAKSIKLEEPNAEADVVQDHAHASPEKNGILGETASNGNRKPSLKRKRGKEEPKQGDAPDGRDSSNLSSTISSPAPQVHSCMVSGARSDRSRSSPPIDDSAHQKHGALERQKTRTDKDKPHRPKAQDGGVSETLNGRGKRQTRSATHFDEASQHSDSPPPSTKNRAQSTQSHLTNPSGVTRRKKPAPLHVERRRKTSEEQAESDDSSSVHSHQRLQKLTCTDGHIMSPAKVSQKNNRDRSGRTLLARACASGHFDEAETWVKGRPQDLNVPDNAGNTPLQVAGLEGNEEIVQLLLGAGCDINCKNIDSDTPLIDAVENGHLDVVRLLLKAGLDPRVGNAQGKEPLVLVKGDDEDSQEIRAALLAAKKQWETIRRRSDDHQRQRSVTSRDVDVPSANASAASPIESNRSPPPTDHGARRRTARSQQTSSSLLWVNATPQALRAAAGKGDIAKIDHILKMDPKVDIESILDAARGGHELALGLLLACAQPKPDPDPDPLRSGDHRQGYNTPMLAAIGRGNPQVIKLLLEQPGFNPTRTPYKNFPYYEIARDRGGSAWQEEYKLLKEAHDEYKKTGGRKSNSSTPRKIRTKKPESGRSTPEPEPSSTPQEARKMRRPPPPVKHESDPDVKRKPSYKGTASRQRGESREFSNVSDREAESAKLPKAKPREKRSNSDAASSVARSDGLKPKRKLMSGHDFKLDQDQKRRASLVAEHPSKLVDGSARRKSGESVSSHGPLERHSSDGIDVKSKKATSEEPVRPKIAKGEPGKKRLRVSVSPQANRSDFTDLVKKKKRQRVDSQGNAIDQDRERTSQPGPATVAPMISNPPSTVSPGQCTAPVAFMGSSTTSPMNKSPTDGQSRSDMISPVNSIDQALQQSVEDDKKAQRRAEEEKRQEEERKLEAESLEKERLARIEAERIREAEAERERIAKVEREEAERKARIAQEAEEARLEVQRQAEEAERQLQIERDAEEARIAKKKRDEELLKRRLEEDKQRREEQERRRREREERETLRRLRQRQEEERARMEALPNGLRRAAELGPDGSRSAKEILKWLPLRTVTTSDLDPHCPSHIANELWISNVQAAPILAIQDLDLSQCKYSPTLHFSFPS